MRFFLVVVASFWFSMDSLAGEIRGKAIFEGQPPAMREIDMNADPICATKHDTPAKYEYLLLGEGQTMANVLVRVVSGLPAKDWPAPESAVELTQEGCRYAPHVFAVRVGQPLRILNPDGTLHNVHGLAKENPEFNKTMTKTTADLALTFDKPEAPFALRCQVHNWMEAWCAVVDHPFFAVTTTDGSFAISGLPAGKFTVEAWHEKLGTRQATVIVTENGQATTDFTFSRPRPAH